MHLPTRLEDENKMKSWCWKWSERNFGIIAAIMLLLGQVKEDFECFDRTFILFNDMSYVLLQSKVRKLKCTKVHTYILTETIRNGSEVEMSPPDPSLINIENMRRVPYFRCGWNIMIIKND